MFIKLSSKDRSLILFIAAFLALIWFSFSFFSQIFFSSAFFASDAAKIITQYKDDDARWLNVSRPLERDDLKDRIILLDFWTYACVNCIHAIPEIKKLEQEFGNKLTVIGVHSGKFSNEKDFDSIKKAVLKYDISHPVINDEALKIWNSFEVNAWPSFILINPHGNVVKRYVGEEDIQYIRKDVKRMVGKYRYQLNRNDLPEFLEKNKIAMRVLSYPSKITYSNKFSYKSYNGAALFIANSGRNEILVTTLGGEILLEIGSKSAGFQDGNITQARFNNPTGLLYKNQKLYVADTANHAIREIDFKENKVITLLGTGLRGQKIRGQGIAARDTTLASPSDIEFYPDEDNLAIANSGTHQILKFNLKNKTVSVLAGDGLEGIIDGIYPKNSLAQTSDLKAFGTKLYFIDSETSSLRVLNKNGEVETLIGKGLFEFGQKDGDKNNALMQHPLGLTVSSKGVYISDSFNHTIRKYDFASKKLYDFIANGKKGEELGKTTNFDEPDGIIFIDEKEFIVCDTNNNRLVRINANNLQSSIIDVMPTLSLPKEGFLQYLPNLNKAKSTTITSKNAKMEIVLQSDWKLNEMGPSFINLLEMVDEKEAHLIKTFDWNMIKNSTLELPDLAEKKKYMIQGTIYYCQNKRNAPCYISSYEQEFEINKDEKNNTLTIELIYQ